VHTLNALQTNHWRRSLLVLSPRRTASARSPAVVMVQPTTYARSCTGGSASRCQLRCCLLGRSFLAATVGRCKQMPAAMTTALHCGALHSSPTVGLPHAQRYVRDSSQGHVSKSMVLARQMWMWARPLPPGDRPCPGVRRVPLSEDAVCISFGAQQRNTIMSMRGCMIQSLPGEASAQGEGQLLLKLLEP
jgi:hypothetical protein